MSYNNRTLWLGGLQQVWRFENFLAPGQWSEGHDAVLMPMEATTIGALNVHDVRAADEDVYFISCAFNCIANRHPKWSFEPVWKPPFISEFSHGDRCHLNCLALENGKPKYVTCFSETDEVMGWRERNHRESGVIVDVETEEILCRGLDMPHSPQIYRDRLYVANIGCGQFGEVDRETGEFLPICLLPGFTRGLSFFKNYAFVGTSKPRHQGVFEGDDATPLNDILRTLEFEPMCAVWVINLDTGDIEHRLAIEGTATEIYDVCVLPGIQQPILLDLDGDRAAGRFRPAHQMI